MLCLSREYENLNMIHLADIKFKNLIRDNPEDSDIWFEYCQFNLRQHNYIRAEEALWKAIQFRPEEQTYQFLLACFYFNRGRVTLARETILKLLELDRLNPLFNTFMAFTYYFTEDRPSLGRKYLAVSQRLLMREKGYLPQKGKKFDPRGLEKIP